MSKEIKPKDKRKIAPQRILEEVIEFFITDAALAFTVSNDPYDVGRWIHLLKLNIIHAARRKDMVSQPKHDKLTDNEKFELLIARVRAKVSDILEIEERKSKAASVLEIAVPEGPPPLPPQKDPECEEQADLDASSRTTPV